MRTRHGAGSGAREGFRCQRRGERLALIYDGNQSAFLRRGEFKNGEPVFGEPIKIASHTARLIGTTPLTASADRVTLLFGGNTVWTQSASVDALLHGKRLESAK